MAKRQKKRTVKKGKLIRKKPATPAFRRREEPFSVGMEMIKGERYYIARFKGRFFAKRKIKEAGFNFQRANEIFRRNLSFDSNVINRVEPLVNVNVITKRRKNNKIFKKDLSTTSVSRVGAYVVVNGKYIGAQSASLKKDAFPSNVEEMKESARQNLFNRIPPALGVGVSDPVAGIQILEDRDLLDNIKYEAVRYRQK